MADALTVDARGTFCPVPILRLAQAVRAVGAGQELLLLATDHGVEEDLAAWCRATGHDLLSFEAHPEELRGRVRVNRAAPSPE